MVNFEELEQNEEFSAKLMKCTTEQEIKELKAEYNLPETLEFEIDEKRLEEIVGGGKICNFLNNCKYACTKCHETFATEAMAHWHWFKMSFKGGGLSHTYNKIK